MVGISAIVRTVVTSTAVLALLMGGCDLPEAFHGGADAAVVWPDTGAGGMSRPGATGGIVGAAGAPATGGSAGSAALASIGGSSGAAGASTGGLAGSGGLGGSGGQAGSSDQSAGGGGMASGGAASGGTLGSGGVAGMGGGAVASSGGAGGRVGTGGGSAGARGSGGAGGTGAGGAGGSLGTNPCAGLCPSPIVFTTTPYSSDALGTAETCHETTASLIGGICTNFTTRTFKINGTMISTSGASWPPLPAKRNGGYCFQASAGTPAFASFAAY